MEYHIGQLVKWNDPGINDYEPEDREYVRNRVFEIVDFLDEDHDGVQLEEVEEISGGCSEAEAWVDELEPYNE